MSHFKNFTKKIVIGSMAAIALSTIYTPTLLAGTGGAAGTTDATGAGGGSSLLAKIAEYTNGTLTALTSTNNPVVVAIVAALTNLTAPDNATNPASPTPTLQNSFTTYVTQSAASDTAQTSMQPRLISDFFGADITGQNTPYANDLAFTSLLGNPVLSPDPRKDAASIDSGLNYIRYASGLNLNHAVPGNDWTGSASDQKRYINYFNSVIAIQTFDAYILSRLYTDTKNGIPAAQTALINQASDPTTWFATITSESIGAVLRQTLMYQSQSYIVLTQILETEKMLLAAQAMNNTSIILSGQMSEAMMAAKAVKKQSGGL